MALSFCSFSSGSSGNCYLVKSEETAILVDAGLSRKKVLEGLEKTNTDREQLAALMISHEHTDHVKGVKTLLNKEPNLLAYANEATWQEIGIDICQDRQMKFVTGDQFQVGDIMVKTFPISHDAVDPVGYTFMKEDAGEMRQISIVTDTGCMEERLISEIENADILVLEANHDEEMLKFGKYPWFLKQRVLGEHGHLSNTAAGKILLKLLNRRKKKRCVLLAHLSRENNFPEMAMQTVTNILEEENYYVGKDVYLNTILRDEVSYLYEV